MTCPALRARWLLLAAVAIGYGIINSLADPSVARAGDRPLTYRASPESVTATQELPSSRRIPAVGMGASPPEYVSPGLPTILPEQSTPIDLNSAFRLGGVENPQIQIAVARVAEAVAVRQFAAAQILPTINAGSNYNNHTGNLQQSNGNILAVNRSALFLGAGANAVGSGTVNTPGLVWDTNVSVAVFDYLKSRQLVVERQFNTAATSNEMLLQVAVAYLELLRAEQARAIALQIREEAKEVARLTAAFAETGQGRQADADRAATELRQREADVLAFEGDILTNAARLAQLLNLDPSIRLHPADGWAMPKAIVPVALTLPELIAMGLLQRPELGERRAAIQRALLDLNSAKLLPFSPNVVVAFSAGTFGGGSNLVTPTFGAFAPRSDFDTIAYWTLQNLAVGNRAIINASAARFRISNLEQVVVLNRVRSEVASALARTQARYAQIGINEKAVKTGQDGFREDLVRIRGHEGLPIEVLNSLRLLARARMEYLGAIIDFNRAEFELYVALGQPPARALLHVEDPLPPNSEPRNP